MFDHNVKLEKLRDLGFPKDYSHLTEYSMIEWLSSKGTISIRKFPCVNCPVVHGYDIVAPDGSKWQFRGQEPLDTFEEFLYAICEHILRLENTPVPGDIVKVEGFIERGIVINVLGDGTTIVEPLKEIKVSKEDRGLITILEKLRTTK
jgi:hypothetical protein